MLFALPVIRNTMPGVPSTGTLADFTVYFWAILTVALRLLVIGITYIRRTITVGEHGRSDDPDRAIELEANRLDSRPYVPC